MFIFNIISKLPAIIYKPGIFYKATTTPSNKDQHPCSSKNMCKESKESICYNGTRMSEREREREREAHACCSCAERVMDCVEGFNGTCIYSN